MLDIKSNVKTFPDIYECILIWKKTLKIMSWGTINCLTIWKEDNIQEEITFLPLLLLKYIYKLNA